MKTARNAFLFIVTLLCALSCFAQQTPPTPATQSTVAVANNVQLVIEGKVINVHDGDTVTVLDQNNQKFHIRLQGIDAPELKQEFGSVSQQNLSRMVLGKQVSIFWTKVDKYRRTVGTIKLNGQDMNIEQVKAGLAWHFKKYADEQEPQDRITYAAAEQQARAAKLGLWQDPNPTMPGDWRQEVKTKRWGPPPPEGTIIGNRNSKKYQRPDCSGYRDTSEKNRVFFKTVEEAEAAGYKRAGNCPAEIQIVQTKVDVIAPTISQPATAAISAPVTSPVATPKSAPDVVTIKAEPPAVPANGHSAPNTTTDLKIIGNKNSKVYHLPGCSSYARVSEKNQVKFDSAAEAEKAGYRLAGNCSPKQ
jgi:endonuclease YncB( thermonuclease family)